MKIKTSLFTIIMALVANYVIAQKVLNLKPITLTNALNNQPVSLNDYKDAKGIVVIFTSNYCPYSKLYDARIDKLASQYNGKGIQFVLVNSNNPASSKDDSIEDMSKQGKQKGYNFPYLADKDQKLQSALGATKTPEVFVLRPQGANFQIVYTGAIDDNPQVGDDVSKQYLKDAVEAVLAGKEPVVKSTRATGCMIKKT